MPRNSVPRSILVRLAGEIGGAFGVVEPVGFAAEFHNPHLGERGEADWMPSLASHPRRVVVVGAGPAGLEAAWIAAARGHEVHLFGAGPSAHEGHLVGNRL